jgi:hypothetical protein
LSDSAQSQAEHADISDVLNLESRTTNQESRASRLIWTLAFLAPNLLLVMWLFRFVSPITFFTTNYGLKPDSETSFTGTLPLAGLCIAVLFAWLCGKVGGEHRGSPPIPRRNPFEVGLIAAIFLTTGISIALIGPGLLLNLLRVCAGLLVVVAAAGIGLRVIESRWVRLEPDRFGSSLELLVLSSAIGLGVIALLVFGLGSAGILGKWAWWPLILGLIVLSFRPLKTLGANLYSSSTGFARRHDPVAVAVVSFVVIWILLHAVLIWTPPIDYDVLEYHLGAPAQYLRDGRVSFLHENVYATLPENGEMLYLLGMILGGDKLSGLPIAHAVLFATWVLTICGVYAISRRITDNGLRLEKQSAIPAAIAALIYALIPHGTMLVTDFFVEHVQALFHLSAVGAAIIFFAERRAGVRECSGWLVLSGLLAGLACGTKSPAMLLTAAPLALLIAIFCWFSGSIHLALRVMPSFVIPLLLSLAPWLFRNGIISGDPLYPLGVVMKKRTRAAGTTPDHLDHLEANIRAGELSLAAVGRTARQLFPSLSKPDQWLNEVECGPQLLSFSLPGFFAARNLETIFVVTFFVVDVAIWFLFTYRINRFFYPLCSVLAVIAAIGIARLWQIPPLRKGIVGVAFVIVATLGPLPMRMLSLANPDTIVGLESLQDSARQLHHALGPSSADRFEAWRKVNALPANVRVLCIGDAQTFYLDRTPAYSVVFNSSLLEQALMKSESAADVAHFLSERGITHIYINYTEWLRLDQSYALSRTLGGKWQPAALDEKQVAALKDALEKANFALYGQSWPVNVFPAYLKVADDDYPILDEFLMSYTRIEWISAKNQSCELRTIISK